jgi:hypothetical protein
MSATCTTRSCGHVAARLTVPLNQQGIRRTKATTITNEGAARLGVDGLIEVGCHLSSDTPGRPWRRQRLCDQRHPASGLRVCCSNQLS